MTVRTLYFVAATGIFLAVLLSIAAYYLLHSRRRELRWEKLIANLTWIDRNSIAEIALDLVDEFGQPRATGNAGTMEPSKMWKLIGGLEGLAVLERNSELLIDLAFYLQQWYPEAVILAERLRLDARQLKWHLGRLNGAAARGNLQVSFSFYAQRAVVNYYVMTQRLLLLHETGRFPMLGDLRKAL
ncbi:MAG: hypothetical protein WA510_25545 [Acidobacteriaceae bacterium]